MADEEKNNEEQKLADEDQAENSAAAVEAIVESARNRADEIEEALDTALLDKESEKESTSELEPEPAAETVEMANMVEDTAEEVAIASSFSASPKNAEEMEEPQLKIHVGKDDIRISTGHPLIDDIAAQLEKSRKFTMYSVSSLCVALLAGVLFYIFMSTQISQKISEVDAMIGAVAKRTLQVTKGIETFSTLEGKIAQTITNQEALAETLAANDLAVAALEERIAAVNKNMQSNIGQVVGESSNYLVQTRSVLQEENQKAFNTLGDLQKILAEQRGMIAPIGNLSRELSQVQRDLVRVRQTIDDLYIIERARMARELSDQRNAAVGEPMVKN
jgi:hypothetical protein